ncbi:hypothetical protein [Actomonas aquatica]|uniref:Recombinase A n=1 Tax=Actomonas aquatica TaxID=2866162 RepID=A0ABZ1CD60_9BACT|nr:hypothetical protein [Opitutus sp. WL0086]WRQ89526.1 hypothetical protein K1X11_008905 [Opitutus sp. WL0086]
MSSAPSNLAALRHLLAERFPSAHRTVDPARLPTGLKALDEPTGGGLPLAALTELVAPAPSGGSHLLLGQLLAATRARRQRAALVDPTTSFDPESHPPATLQHLVWARGGSVTDALTVTDLFARDANLGLVVLDLRSAALRDLRRVPAPLWYRLQRAVEDTQLALLVITPRALVPSAALRLELNTPHPLADLARNRPDLLPQLLPHLARQRQAHALSA